MTIVYQIEIIFIFVFVSFLANKIKMETSKKNSENAVVVTKKENKENDSGEKKEGNMENDSREKKTGFLDDSFEFENLSETQLDSFCHAISRYQRINSYKLAVQILGDGASDEEKNYLTRQVFSDSIEKMESLL